MRHLSVGDLQLGVQKYDMLFSTANTLIKLVVH